MSPVNTAQHDETRRSTPDGTSRESGFIVGTRTFVVVALLVLLELGLHHLGHFGWWTTTVQSARYGWRMLPEQTGWSRDLTTVEQINGFGFRDREWDAPVVERHVTETRTVDGREQTVEVPVYAKDEDVYRIALVGNSMSYGTSVPIEQVWGRVLEHRLAEHFASIGDPRRVLVMNFAVQGYVYEQMLHVYEDQIRPFRPDLFILPTHPHDPMPLAPTRDDAEYDFRDLVLRTATFDMLSRHVMNQWIPRVPVPAEARRVQRFFSQLDQAMNDRPFGRDKQPYWQFMTFGREDGALLPRVDGMDRGLPSVEADAMAGIMQVHGMVTADGGELVLMSLPRWRLAFEPKLLSTGSKWEPLARRSDGLHHVDPMPAFMAPMEPIVTQVTSIAATSWKRVEGEAGGQYWQVPDMNLRRWVDDTGAERSGADIEHAEQSLFFLDDVGHYSAPGHRIIGEQVFEQLRRQGVF